MVKSPQVNSRLRRGTEPRRFGWLFAFLVAVAGAAITASGPPTREQGKDRNDEHGGGGQSYAIGLWGDLPYRTFRHSAASRT